MDMLGLIREWVRIRQDKRDHCKSCDILQEQLSNALAREQRLLAMLNQPKVVEVPVEVPQEFQPIKQKATPWHIKRQLLEAEDRARALALRDLAAKGESSNPNQNSEISVKELEQELGIGAS